MTELKSSEDCKYLEEARAIAVKWVKFDWKVINNNPLFQVEKQIAKEIIMRWMNRLNITEEDLN